MTGARTARYVEESLPALFLHRRTRGDRRRERGECTLTGAAHTLELQPNGSRGNGREKMPCELPCEKLEIPYGL